MWEKARVGTNLDERGPEVVRQLGVGHAVQDYGDCQFQRDRVDRQVLTVEAHLAEQVELVSGMKQLSVLQEPLYSWSCNGRLSNETHGKYIHCTSSKSCAVPKCTHIWYFVTQDMVEQWRNKHAWCAASTQVNNTARNEEWPVIFEPLVVVGLLGRGQILNVAPGALSIAIRQNYRLIKFIRQPATKAWRERPTTFRQFIFYLATHSVSIKISLFLSAKIFRQMSSWVFGMACLFVTQRSAR